MAKTLTKFRRRQNYEPSARLDNHAASCESKTDYTSERLALKAARQAMGVLTGRRLTVYECPVCFYWHLTSSN